MKIKTSMPLLDLKQELKRMSLWRNVCSSLIIPVQLPSGSIGCIQIWVTHRRSVY
jgi:hypothetical protein